MSKEKKIKKIGIMIEPEVCMGAKCNQEGEVELIENFPFDNHDFDEGEGYELEYAAGVNGFNSLLDAGVAVSDIGIAMRRIMKNECISDESVYAAIAMPSDYPMAEQIHKFMELQKVLAQKDEDSKFSVEAYNELELENLTSFELIEKAAEQAGIEKYRVIMRPLAIAYAYEFEYPGCALSEGERGLIYDWNKYYFSATIIEKREGELDVLWSETIEDPMEGDRAFLCCFNDDLLKQEEECFLKTLEVIHEMCGLSGFYIDTIDAVYLAGDFCDTGSVASRLEDIFNNVFFMEDNRLAVLRGTAHLAQELKDDEEDEVSEDVADNVLNATEGLNSKETGLEDSNSEESDLKEIVSEDSASEEIDSEEIDSKEIDSEKIASKERNLQEVNIQEQVTLVPTLFKFSTGMVTKTRNGMEVDLVRVYDNKIRDSYMQKGHVFNVLLPYFAPPRSVLYAYKGEHQIDFKLRKKPNNRMLMLELIDSGADVSKYEESCFGHAEFFAVPNKSKKGKLQLNYSLDAYEKLETLDENNYLIVTDQGTQMRYVFECWIDQLPMPGIDRGVYAYLDGSSNNDSDPEDIAAGYVLNIGTDVYFGHKDSHDKGRNVSAEYLAGTKVFEQLPKMGRFASVTIYFDNINVGYVIAGLYNSGTEFGNRYLKTFQQFMKNDPNINVQFIHTDSHSYIYGNEMADQMAQGKQKDLMKLAKDFKENRDKICPEDGGFSEIMKFVGV